MDRDQHRCIADKKILADNRHIARRGAGYNFPKLFSYSQTNLSEKFHLQLIYVTIESKPKINFLFNPLAVLFCIQLSKRRLQRLVEYVYQ